MCIDHRRRFNIKERDPISWAYSLTNRESHYRSPVIAVVVVLVVVVAAWLPATAVIAIGRAIAAAPRVATVICVPVVVP